MPCLKWESFYIVSLRRNSQNPWFGVFNHYPLHVLLSQLVFIFHESYYMVEFLTAAAECLSILLRFILF